MKHRITLIPGDGIGPEVAAAVVRIIEASGVKIEWEEHLAGQQALDKFGKTLDLYANLRPVRALPNVPCRNPGLDLVVVRENTESLYSGIEHEIIPGVIESLKIITEKASTRIARFAFAYARN